MKKLLPFFTFVCLSALSITSSLPVMAGGCSSNRSKSNEIKCGKDDTECKSKNTEKFDFNKAINS